MPDPRQAPNGIVYVNVEGLGRVPLPADVANDPARLEAAIDAIPESAFEAARSRGGGGERDDLVQRGTPPPAEPIGVHRPDPMTDAAASAGRFLGGVGDALNPMPLIRSVGGALMDERGPDAGLRKMAVGMGEGVAEGSRRMGSKASERFQHAKGSSGMDRILSGLEAGGYGLAAGIPVLGPAAAGVGERIAGGDIAGGLGEAAGLAGGGIIGRAAGTATKAAALPIARGLLGTSAPGVAEAALKYRALPGVVRSGPNRTGRRMAAAEESAMRAVNRQGANTPVNLRSSPKRNQAWDDITESFTEKTDVTEPRNIAETQALFAASKPTAGKALKRARATERRVLGDAGPRGVMGRAVASDTRAGVTRAVPRAGTALAEVDALSPVAEAYAAKPGHILPTEGLPDMKSRLVVSSLNRAAGPGAQTLYNTGIAMDPIIRAAVIENLLRRGYNPDDAAAEGE